MPSGEMRSGRKSASSSVREQRKRAGGPSQKRMSVLTAHCSGGGSLPDASHLEPHPGLPKNLSEKERQFIRERLPPIFQKLMMGDVAGRLLSTCLSFFFLAPSKHTRDLFERCEVAHRLVFVRHHARS